MRLGLLRQSYTREELAAWAFLFPGMLLLIVFIIAPFVMSIVLSFTNMRLVGPLPTRFIGLRNYVRLLTDPDFWQAFRNTVVFAAAAVPLQSSLALLLATRINKRIHAINVFRGIYFIPVVIPMVVVCIVWLFLLGYPAGLLNTIVQAVTLGHVGPYNWLGNPALALPTIIGISIWQGVGFQMIIYLAGLQRIPTELYEAGCIDGASPWQQFWHITMPGLRNTHVFVMVTTTILAFRLFTQVEVLTQGGPLGVTNTLVRYIFIAGFRKLRVGYASAATVVFVLIVLSISLFLRRLIREEHEVV